MNVEYQFVGQRRDNIKMPATESVPHAGDIVLFIESFVETEYTVKHVYHIVEDDKITIQVVLR